MSAEVMFKCLKIDIEGPVTTITINRPEALNALNGEVLSELNRALSSTIEGHKTRVLVLTGAGDKAFVAGADIAAMASMSAQEATSFAQLGHQVMERLESLPIPVVAKVQGFALGGGCELAMACDIIVAGRSAKFGQPEANLGLVPGFGATQRLVRRIGLPLALDLLLTGRGRTLSAEEACQAGLIARVTDDATLNETVDGLVKSLLKCGPVAISTIKTLARSAGETSLAKGLQLEALSFGAAFQGSEAKEGIAAFLEKRPANFRSDYQPSEQGSL